MIKMRTQLETPRAPQHGIHSDSRVVKLLGMEPSMASQTPRVIGVIPLFLAAKHVQIPIPRDVPPEGVSRIYEDGAEPEAKERGFRHSEFRGRGRALESAEDDDGEGGGIFQSVG